MLERHSVKIPYTVHLISIEDFFFKAGLGIRSNHSYIRRNVLDFYKTWTLFKSKEKLGSFCRKVAEITFLNIYFTII
jgi:hypothetical protein